MLEVSCVSRQTELQLSLREYPPVDFSIHCLPGSLPIADLSC